MAIPNKYAGASKGPWHTEPCQNDLGASIAIVGQDAFIVALIPPSNPDEAHDMNTAERHSEDTPNSLLLADAPMLACRVAELEDALEKLLGIVESEYEADPEPEDLPGWKEAIEAGRKALDPNQKAPIRADHGEKAA